LGIFETNLGKIFYEGTTGAQLWHIQTLGIFFIGLAYTCTIEDPNKVMCVVFPINQCVVSNLG
jgi:hypothetical protein